MDIRTIFDEDCINYDKWRPRYTEALFQKIFSYAPIGEDSRVLEIGIGTGQATQPFLEKGCALTAVEPGKNMAQFVAEHFREYPRFHIENQTFEDFDETPDCWDLLYSATAFHWIPAEIGYAKAISLLKSGGAFAVFWNRPDPASESEPLHRAIQAIYEKYGRGRKEVKGHEADRYELIRKRLLGAGFTDVEMHLFNRTRRFRGEEYVHLLNTYSDHRSMPEAKRLAFESEIRETIDSTGAPMAVYDTMDLYLARKP